MSSSPLGPRPLSPPGLSSPHSSSPPTVDSFLYLLHSSSGRPLFFEHLRNGFSEHHLLFWEQVQQYKRLSLPASSPSSPVPSSSTDLSPTPLQKAQSITSRFITTGSPLQINITEQARLRITSQLTKAGGVAPQGLFDESEHVVVELMKGNYFFSFKETEDYQRWLRDEKKAAKKTAKADRSGKTVGKGGSKFCTLL